VEVSRDALLLHASTDDIPALACKRHVMQELRLFEQRIIFKVGALTVMAVVAAAALVKLL
jgi:hypothetical protein